MTEYIPVLILMGLGLVVGVAAVVLSAICGVNRPNRMKNSVYECGAPPAGDARRPMTVKFYLVAILFLLFDVEAVFFFPWAVVYRKFLEINAFIVGEMVFFVALLLVGYVYVLKKGALDWD